MDGASVSLEADESATCTITNTYDPPLPETGSLTVTKKLTGNLIGFAGGDFTFSVTCDDESYGPVTINLSSGSASASPIAGIPAGADCSVTETAAPPGTYAGWMPPPTALGHGRDRRRREEPRSTSRTRTYNPPQAETSITIVKERSVATASSTSRSPSATTAAATLTIP